jgi:hypothetical protein
MGLLYDVFYAHSSSMDSAVPWNVLELIAELSKSDPKLIGTTASCVNGGVQNLTLTQDGWRED